MQSKLKYLKLWEEHGNRVERLAQLGLLNPDEIGVQELVLMMLRERYPDLLFVWSRNSGNRLMVTQRDGLEPSYMGRAASNRGRIGFAGEWIWRSWLGVHDRLQFSTDALDPDRTLKLAKAIADGSARFLDRVYGESVQESAAGGMRSRLRLHSLGMATEPLQIISVAVNWEATGESETAFTYRDYYDWPGSFEYDRWSEHLDHFEGQIRDWLGAEAQGMPDWEVFRQWPRFSDRVLPMLLKWLRDENWEILHLTHEGQFYDIQTGALIGEGTIVNPKWLS